METDHGPPLSRAGKEILIGPWQRDGGKRRVGGNSASSHRRDPDRRE